MADNQSRDLNNEFWLVVYLISSFSKLRAQANGKTSNETTPDCADETADKTIVSMTLENITNSDITVHERTDKAPEFGTPVSD